MTAGFPETFGVDRAGPGAAPALVLVPGAVVSRKVWLPQVRALSDEFRVIAVDLPGHGDRAAQPFSFAAAAACVADVIRTPAGGRDRDVRTF